MGRGRHMFSVLYGNSTESIWRNHVSVNSRNCIYQLFISFSTASTFLDNPRIFRVPIGTHPEVRTSSLFARSNITNRVGFGIHAHRLNRWGAIFFGYLWSTPLLFYACVPFRALNFWSSSFDFSRTVLKWTRTSVYRLPDSMRPIIRRQVTSVTKRSY